MPKILNHSTTIPLTQVKEKLNPHLEIMNSKSWELMSAAIEAIGIEEYIILFWKKTITDTESPKT